MICLDVVALESFLLRRVPDYVGLSTKSGKPFDDIKKAFISAFEDAGIEGLVCTTYGPLMAD